MFQSKTMGRKTSSKDNMSCYRAFIIVLIVSVSTFQEAATDESNALAARANKIAIQLEIEGAIGPATIDYIGRNLDKAAEMNAILVLLRIDTPGGLDASMRQIIKKIIASPIPVVGYVSPGGARAASAGTYILYASHVAAMAPATNLGAATPVQIGGFNPFDMDKNKDSDKPSDPKDKPIVATDAMSQKILNDAVAYIRGLAKMRGRNIEWAEKAVTEAASLPAEEALKLNVIDVVAMNQSELLEKLAGRKVNVLGQDITLETNELIVNPIKPDWRNQLLTHITNPSIAYILMLIGIYGLIFEFSNPGAIIPGTLGGICLLLALFAFQLLPVNYVGVALIILGIALMVAEAFVPSIGILGFGGIVAFVIGSVILIDTDAPGFGIDLGIIGAFALTSAGFLILVIGMLLRSQRNPVVSGVEQLIGGLGEAINDFDDTGLVRIHSENWNARTDRPLHRGDKIIVKGIDGLTLLITPEIEEKK